MSTKSCLAETGLTYYLGRELCHFCHLHSLLFLNIDSCRAWEPPILFDMASSWGDLCRAIHDPMKLFSRRTKLNTI